MKKEPQELPGFYYDPEKKRYFLLKSPIPGTRLVKKSDINASPSSSNKIKGRGPSRSLNKLLTGRELDGGPFSGRQLLNHFMSNPGLWKYRSTQINADAGLERVSLNCQTSSGLCTLPFLLAANSRGILSLLQVGTSCDSWKTYLPDCVHPMRGEPESPSATVPLTRSRFLTESFNTTSGISSLKSTKWRGKDSERNNYALITTLGSAICGGVLYFWNLDEPFDHHSSDHVISMVTCIRGTCWTAACNGDATQAVIGTNRGTAFVNLETGHKSWVLRCNSDVLAQKFDSSGNVILCGLRNGAIVMVDVREKFRKYFTCPKQRLVRLSSGQKNTHPRNHWFEVQGKIHPSRTCFMPSAVCSLEGFLSDDCYFLASSMDGSISLYDFRKFNGGAVQTYDGHVNSHSRIQFGVDPSEKFVMSGGEDRYVRLWAIKSGDLLMEKRVSDIADEVPVTISWESTHSCRTTDGSWAAWFGSCEAIYRMQW